MLKGKMLLPNFLCVVTPDLRHKLQVIVNHCNSIIVLFHFLFPKPAMLLKHSFPVYVARLGKMMLTVSATQEVQEPLPWLVIVQLILRRFTNSSPMMSKLTKTVTKNSLWLLNFQLIKLQLIKLLAKLLYNYNF